MPDCNNDLENDLVTKARRLLATYEDMAELIRMGAYQRGADAGIDEAIFYQPLLEDFLSQDIHERCELNAGYEKLAGLLNQSMETQVVTSTLQAQGADA